MSIMLGDDTAVQDRMPQSLQIHFPVPSEFLLSGLEFSSCPTVGKTPCKLVWVVRDGWS